MHRLSPCFACFLAQHVRCLLALTACLPYLPTCLPPCAARLQAETSVRLLRWCQQREVPLDRNMWQRWG